MELINYDDIEELVYIKKNYSEAYDKLKKNFKGNHKCNRDNNCICIQNGKLLIEIFMNSNEIDSEKISMISFMNEFFQNAEINLPYDLFIYMCKNIIKLHHYSVARSLIGNYILYSNIITDKQQYKPFGISIDQYETLNEILIFDIIIPTKGLNTAKPVIDGLSKYKEIKDKFNERLENISKNYKENSCIKDFEKDNTFNSSQIKIPIYSNFIVRNSILQRIILFLLNKRIIILLVIILGNYLIKKTFNKNMIELILKLLKFINSFKYVRLILSPFEKLMFGIITLLINY